MGIAANGGDANRCAKMSHVRSKQPTALLALLLLAAACGRSPDTSPAGVTSATSGSGGRLAAAAGGSAQSAGAAAGRLAMAGAGAGAGGAGARAMGFAGAAPDDAGAIDPNDAGAAVSGVCPGVSPPPFRVGAVGNCTRNEECTALHYACRTAPPDFGCGPVGPRRECPGLQECAATEVCAVDGCGGSRCIPACTASSCNGNERCLAGLCVRKRCDEAGALPCPDRYACDPLAAGHDENGCLPIRCRSASDCDLGWDCAPANTSGANAHGCVHRTCKTAADCDCGSCVVGLCEPYPGACYNIAPPP